MKKILLFILLISSAHAVDIATAQENQSMWIALFALATTGIVSLYFSSEQLKRINIKHKEMMKLKEDMDEKNHMILETMSQNIEISTKGIRRYKDVLKQNDFKSMSEDFFQEETDRFKESETLLLDATHELIDFLQLKSGNLEVVEESYKLSNMLNETYGFISDHFLKNKTELVYDIDPEVGTELHGDSKRIEQVLRTFLTDILTLNSIVTLKISCVGKNADRLRLELHNKDKKMLDEEIKALFSTYALSESYKSKEKLDIYVSSELVKQMNGSINVQSNELNGTIYSIELPYKLIKSSSLKSKNSVNKRLLILEDDIKTSQIVSNLFQQHGLSIDCYDSQRLVSHIPNFYNYDMVIVNTKLLFLMIVEKLEKVKKDKNLVVVEIHNNYERKYEDENHKLIHDSIQKPLQNEQVYTLLEKVFEEKSDIDDLIVEKNTYTSLTKVEGIIKDSFSKFSHIHVLIVEDNLMNQKILKGVLGDSGMEIIIVNNGQEALNEIKKNRDIDLVLMDTNMPVMDGYEATEKIRCIYNKKQLPIVAISAIGFKNDLDKMERAGANTFLNKPFQLGELYGAFSMYSTQSQNKIKNINHKLSKYEGNTGILNIETGIKNSNSAIFYKELLQEVLVNLNEINDLVGKWIQKRDDMKIKEFISHALKLAETIGATSFIKILNEMNHLFVYKEEHRLSEYLPLYQKEWNKLRKEIEEYFKTVS